MTTILSLLAQTDEPVGLTVGGIVVMTCSILIVLGLLTFCTVRMLKEPHPEEHHHTPLDIDTKDLDD